MEEKKQPTLFLVDGSYFAYRSFYAIREMSWGGEMKHNAVFGFAHDLRRMSKRLAPDYCAVVWDAGLPEARMQLLPEYKQQRDAMPAELKEQLPVIRQLSAAIGWKNVFLQGNEADDLIATYARQGDAAGMKVIIATNDKDIFQLVNDNIKIYTTAKKHLKEGEAYSLLGAQEVENIWGVPAKLINDILTLTGDSSDNIPGVPGVGPKTAAKLIKASGGLDELLKEPLKYTNPRITGLLEEHRMVVDRNRQLINLNQELPVPLPIESMKMESDHEEAIRVATNLGFRTIVNDIKKEINQPETSAALPVAATTIAKPAFSQGELGF